MDPQTFAAFHPWLAHYPPDVDWHASLPAQPLYALLDNVVQRWPDAIATDFMGSCLTYRQLGEAVKHLASGLMEIGARRGVKVGICLPNCPQFVIAYYAILKTGATVVNFSPLYTAPEIGRQITDSGTEIIITLALQALYPKVAQSLGNTCLKKIVVSTLPEALPPVKGALFSLLKRKEVAAIPTDATHHWWADLLKSPPQQQPVAVYPDSDTAVLQYTGGTTGVPKGVVLTHANLSINARQCRLWFPGVREGQERIMGVLPFFHVFAMTTVMNLGVSIGAELVLHPRFDIKAVLKDIHRKKPTLMPGVPTLFNAINNYADLAKYRLTSLKACISGGGPLPLSVKQEFEKLTGCVLVEGYGLSESSPVVSCNPVSGRSKPGSIGLPLPGTVLEVVSMDDGESALAANQIGEICIRGPQVMHGYRHQLLETSTALRGGRLHTGDVGYMDADGYFTIVDRMKEMIISGGYNIYPRHIEEALYTHEAVAECAVIGMADAARGEVPKAYVVFREGKLATAEALIAHLKAELPSYAVPRLYEFRDALPKTLVGKVDKKALKA